MSKGRQIKLKEYFLKERKILMVVTLTGIVYNLGMVAGPWFEGQMVQLLCDVLLGKRQASQMAIVAASYVAVIGVVQGMRYLKRLYVRKFANNVSRSMRLTLFENLLYQNLGGRRAQGEQSSNGLSGMRDSHSVGDDSGSVMAKLISDADQCVEGMRKFVTEIFDTGVVMVAYAAMLIYYDFRLTIIAMIFPPIAYILAEKLKKIVTENTARSRESLSRLNVDTLERVSNAVTYRVYGQETNRNREYESSLDDYECKAVRANIWENIMPPLYLAISMVGAIVILWFGSKNVIGTGWRPWDVAAFTTYFACYRKLAAKASKSAKLFNSVQKAKVSWGRIKSYLQNLHAPDSLPALEGSLSVSGLSFAYPSAASGAASIATSGRKYLFNDANFSVKPGQIVALSGPVACGKTTLGKILIGEQPYEGCIKVGEQVLSDAGDSYDWRIGYMGHQPQLFSGTIEENICMGAAGSGGQLDVWDALRLVCMDEEVRNFPDGIDTYIGSEGMALSGGQQARIALARTLYHKRHVMVLDDPFSALDSETEAKIFNNLKAYASDCVVILITHRQELFAQVDSVLWIENGKVVEK